MAPLRLLFLPECATLLAHLSRTKIPLIIAPFRPLRALLIRERIRLQ